MFESGILRLALQEAVGSAENVKRAGRLSRATFRLSLILFAQLLLASGYVLAGGAAVEIPEHASATRYGEGWVCDRGYRQSNGVCAFATLPANAYATDLAFGRGWECRRGYLERDDSCVAIRVPPNAYLSPARGDEWKCARGFRAIDKVCVAINVPANGFLTGSSYGSG